VKKAKGKAKKVTAVRAALHEGSTLLSSVCDGMGAVENAHRSYFDDGLRSRIDDSLNLDEATRSAHPQANRWDYVLGDQGTRKLFAVEPHSANTGEISVVIKKKAAALEHLRGHLRNGQVIDRWIWVASGTVRLVPLEKSKFQLDKAGIVLCGRRVMLKDIV
jgi:hypothetical protein